MRILIATDAWRPQVNGVVHTLEATALAAKSLGAEVSFLTPEGFPTVGLPSYPGIRIALPRAREIARRISAARPDAAHIATEGPIGYFVRPCCLANRLSFTASQPVQVPHVAVAGVPPVTGSDIALGANGQALVTFSVDSPYAPLRQGTRA